MHHQGILLVALASLLAVCLSNHLCSLGDKFRNATVYKTVLTDSYYVDIFSLVINPDEYEYIREGEFWLIYKLMTTLCAKHHIVRIHIMSDVDWIIRQGQQQGYYMHDLRSFSDLNATFFALYEPNHHSVNSLHYEYLCFYRWILYNRIVESWPYKDRPIHRIMTLDSDVVFFVDPVEYYFKTIETLHFMHENNLPIAEKGDDFDMLIVSPGAVHLLSSTGLKAYSDYVLHWYNRSSDIILSDTKQIAGYIHKQLHFSDMQMVTNFAKIDPKRRSGCYVSASINQISMRSREDNLLIAALGCVPVTRYKEMFNFGNHLVYKNGLFYGREEPTPFCFVHFQGDGVKEYMKIHLRVMLKNVSLGNNNIVKGLMGSRLLIKSFHANDIYNITEDQYKHKLTHEEFSRHQYTDKMVIKVPVETLSYFVDKP